MAVFVQGPARPDEWCQSAPFEIAQPCRQGCRVPTTGRSGALIGDVHNDARSLRDTVVTLTPRGCNSLVQLGDFGIIWRGHVQQR